MTARGRWPAAASGTTTTSANAAPIARATPASSWSGTTPRTSYALMRPDRSGADAAAAVTASVVGTRQLYLSPLGAALEDVLAGQLVTRAVECEPRPFLALVTRHEHDGRAVTEHDPQLREARPPA